MLTIIGARPQIIKAAALSRAIEKSFKKQVREVILHTGQHYDDSMSEVFFREMQIPKPDYNLKIGSASHGAQTGQMIEGIEKVLLQEQPDGVVVYGDTNSTLAGALAAAKLHIPVIHIEAGLRSFNKAMPEEINRIACDHVSTLLFSPTLTGIKNLEEEGIVHHENQNLSSDKQGVYHIGDVMYDNTLFFTILAMKSSPVHENLGLRNTPYILATVHRPSNTDVTENLASIVRALDQIASEKRIDIVLPLHPRTLAILKWEASAQRMHLIQNNELKHLTPAVSFLDMIRLEAGASVLLTDSGGVQKEAWFMDKPVVVLREETEWVEIIEAGNGVLTGADQKKIVDATTTFLDSPTGEFPPIFGDGRAAHRLLGILTTVNWQ